MELGELDCAIALRGIGIVSERVAGHVGAGAEEGTVDGETDTGEWIGEVAGELEGLDCWYADWAVWRLRWRWWAAAVRRGH